MATSPREDANASVRAPMRSAAASRPALATLRPAFIAELALPANRKKLEISIVSGYLTALAFFLLAIAGDLFHFVSRPWPLYALVALKLVTNTLAYASLRRDVLVLDAGGLNVLADLLCMTAAIYFTGGHQSPLLSIYLIEVSVVALLTNLGTTIVVAVCAFALYAAMTILVHVGTLPQLPTPAMLAGASSTRFLVVQLAFVAVVLGTPTFYTARILRLLREKERELEARNRELVEAGKQKSQFMANITHELRTPIHGICGLSDLVATGVYGAVNDRQKDAQRTIKRSAKSLLGLIDDLLELSRSDAGKVSFTPSDVDLTELLPAVLATVRWMQGTHDRRVEVELGPDLPVIFTDRGKLNQVVINLLANAVKFTSEGGAIALRARRLGEASVEIAVEDDGVGIPAGELERIFEAFHQVDGSAEREYGGAGIGLALARRLTRMMGGNIRVASEEGRGSTFTVTLPVRREGAPREGA